MRTHFFIGRPIIDTLRIFDLKVATHIGIHAWEQQIKQTLLFDLIIPIDINLCQKTLANTIDYADLCQQITTFVAGQSFGLIETVAEQVAELIQHQFSLEHMTVKVSKPHAVPNAGRVQVVLER